MSAGPAALLRRAFPALLLAAALAGCGVFEPSGPTDRLQQARERWATNGTADYRITVGRLCFCLEQAASRVIVEVRNGVVVTRTYLDSGAVVEPQWAALYPDVPGLFRVIEDAIQTETRWMSVTTRRWATRNPSRSIKTFSRSTVASAMPSPPFKRWGRELLVSC